MGELKYSDSATGQSSNIRLKSNGSGGVREFLRNYFGFIPTVGGMVGAMASAAFAGTLYTVNTVMNNPQAVMQLPEVYRSASELAGQLLFPGFVAGQILTYSAKESIGRFIGGRKRN